MFIVSIWKEGVDFFNIRLHLISNPNSLCLFDMSHCFFFSFFWIRLLFFFLERICESFDMSHLFIYFEKEYMSHLISKADL